MDDIQYLDYCQGLLRGFNTDMQKRTRDLTEDEPLRQWVMAMSDEQLDIYGDGPALVRRLFSTYPEFAPLFPRDLLWFLGGDCLHFMPEEEIETFQQLEQLRHEAAARGERLDLISARAKLLKLQ